MGAIIPKHIKSPAVVEVKQQTNAQRLGEKIAGYSNCGKVPKSPVVDGVKQQTNAHRLGGHIAEYSDFDLLKKITPRRCNVAKQADKSVNIDDIWKLRKCSEECVENENSISFSEAKVVESRETVLNGWETKTTTQETNKTLEAELFYDEPYETRQEQNKAVQADKSCNDFHYDSINYDTMFCDDSRNKESNEINVSAEESINCSLLSTFQERHGNRERMPLPTANERKHDLPDILKQSKKKLDSERHRNKDNDKDGDCDDKNGHDEYDDLDRNDDDDECRNEDDNKDRYEDDDNGRIEDDEICHNKDGDREHNEDGDKARNEVDDICCHEDDERGHYDPYEDDDQNNAKNDTNTLQPRQSSPILACNEAMNRYQDDSDKTPSSPSSKKRRSRLHRYEETVILFRPMIVSDVIANQVLPHLQTCLSKSDISAIKGEHNQHKATELLLETIISCKDPGKWKTFVNALYHTGYRTIVDALKRRSIADDNDPRKIVRLFTPQLRDMIIPSEIVVELLRTDVINNDDKNEILQRERFSGTHAAADLLLERLPGKHPDWFGNFLIALRKVGCLDLLQMLTGETETYEYVKGTCDFINAAEETSKKESFVVRNNDFTSLEKKAEAEPEAREDVHKKRKIKYTPIVIDGKICVGNDEHDTEENVESRKKGSISNPKINSQSPDQTYVDDQSSLSLREKKNNLVAETKEIEAELKEYEEILKALEKKNELLKIKRNFCEKIKIKEKEAEALKAAISDDEAAEDNDTNDSSADFEDMVQYFAPGKRLTTIDFRKPGFGTAVVLPPTSAITANGIKPVQLFGVGQNYNDSAFYSIDDSLYTHSQIYTPAIY